MFRILTTKADGTQALFHYDLVHYGSLQHMTTLQSVRAATFGSESEAKAYIKRAKRRSSSEGLAFQVITLASEQA